MRQGQASVIAVNHSDKMQRYMAVSRALRHDEIVNIIERFACTAAVCAAVGFDGVAVHGGVIDAVELDEDPTDHFAAVQPPAAELMAGGAWGFAQGPPANRKITVHWPFSGSTAQPSA